MTVPTGHLSDHPLAAAFKPVDSWWTVLVIDPVAARVLPSVLRRHWITPHRITGAALVVGVGSVTAFAMSAFVLGALLYQLRFFLDCLDGKVARLRGVSSQSGAAFDRLADLVTVPAAYAAIGIVLARQDAVPDVLALLVAAGSLLVAATDAVLEVVRLRGPHPVAAPAAPPAGGLVGWARRHRLTLRPWTVEAETLGLFLAPLLLAGSLLGGVHLALAGVYLVFTIVDLGIIASTTRATDRS